MSVLIVLLGVSSFFVGWIWGEYRALRQVQAAYKSVPRSVEVQAAAFARAMMAGLDDEGEIPILYAEDDEPVHTDESPFCSDVTCPCREGHVVNGRIIVEQEVL